MREKDTCARLFYDLMVALSLSPHYIFIHVILSQFIFIAAYSMHFVSLKRFIYLASVYFVDLRVHQSESPSIYMLLVNVDGILQLKIAF